MKTLINIILIITITLFFTGCEGNLEPHLYGEISSNDVFQTVDDFDAATTALYYELRQKGWGPYLFCDGSSFVMDEVATGEWTTIWAWTNFLHGTWISSDDMAVRFYNWTVPNITRCTYTIARMEESTAVEESIKTQYISQIRALRAFFIFDLYRLYGPLPVIVDAERALYPDPDYKPERPDAEEIESLIVKELRETADDLPVEWSQYGRITKGASLHYLLKFYMHKKEWQKALDIANEIIGLNYYSLQSNYADIFSAQNEGNKELIFVVRAEAIADYGNHTYANIIPGDYPSPHGNTIDGWNGHRMPWEFYDTFHDEDSRKKLIVAEYTSKSGNHVDLRANGDAGALPLKYGIDPEAAGVWAGNDKVLDRYAEVLLFKAEALNELNGPNSESINLINEIRNRAFGGGVTLPTQTIISEEFDTEINGEWAGAFSMNNFDQDGPSDWTYTIDNSGVLSGNNSLHIHVINSGSEFWTLQIRADEQPITQGRTYNVRFKAKASQNVTFDFRAEGPLTHTQQITLMANEIKDFNFDTQPSNGDGLCVVFFALGNTGSNYDLWLDAFVLEAKEQLPGDSSENLIKLSNFTDKESLRDWILMERGWEFWYEGKRREDLIRMGKYMEVGQQNASNFTEKNYLFPIPTDKIIENPKLTQNPGY